MLNTAIKAAHEAGKELLKAQKRRLELHIENKGDKDFVSEVDRHAERIIIDMLSRAYPSHSFLAEESGSQAAKYGDSEYEWVIDPLDGTTNFLHGHPQFSVSIALKKDNRLLLGLVHDPLRDELFYAERGKGCYLNNQRLRVSTPISLNDTLLATGFPFKYQQHLEAYLNMFKALFAQVADIRRAGSAALDLAYLAAGRVDGFWEIGLKPWDIAAGVLLIEEAGGLVTDFGGSHHYFETGNLVAGNPKILNGILQTIKPHLTADLKL
ncbi:inositol monophosphatase [Thioflexithrix psekupsensis]|uniref:Inositol-1-monophosphatase n=2 Tax=Thioflexithrix psekupsensis TaxID=1570016 RepID=A0A251XBF4_9GAMM|nr:inositol monophosphatase [Thioflexithrix psekupsensis]